MSDVLSPALLWHLFPDISLKNQNSPAKRKQERSAHSSCGRKTPLFKEEKWFQIDIEAQQLSKTGIFFAVRLMLKSFSVSYNSSQGQESISRERGNRREKGAYSRHCDNCLAVESIVGVNAALTGGDRSGEAGDLTSNTDKPMLGFRLFFPSPMQKEICSEASPSSTPVYWGCAWVQPQVFQVTSI